MATVKPLGRSVHISSSDSMTAIDMGRCLTATVMSTIAMLIFYNTHSRHWSLVDACRRRPTICFRSAILRVSISTCSKLFWLIS